MEYIESAALCPNAEVSLAALKSFHEILNIPATDSPSLPNSESTRSSDELKALFGRRDITITEEPEPTGGMKDEGSGFVDEVALWSHAWRVWRSIGTSVTDHAESSSSAHQSYVPSQSFLTALVLTFPALFSHIRSQFVAAELQRLFVVLQRALHVPVTASSVPFFVVPVNSSSDAATMTPLHDAVLGAIKVIVKVVIHFTYMSYLYVYVYIRMHYSVCVFMCRPMSTPSAIKKRATFIFMITLANVDRFQ